MRRSSLFTLAACAASLFVAAPAWAAPSPSASASASTSGSASASGSGSGAGNTSGKKVRVGIDTEVFGWANVNPDGGPSDDSYNLVGFGVGRALLSEQAFVNGGAGGPFGIGVGTLPHVGIHAGGVILDGRAVVGARFAFALGGFTTEREDDFHAFLFSGELVPYFRWMFMQGWLRPYVEGHFGFGGGLVRTTNTDPMVPDDANSATTHVIAPLVGAGGGAMFFLTDSVSIDLGLGFDYAAPHGRATYEEEAPPVFENTDWQKLSDNIALNITAGISGWF